jgi:hypothetical protein
MATTMTIRQTRVKGRFQLHLEEASALCVRRDLLLAVGDKDFMVATAELDGERLTNEYARWVNSMSDGKKPNSQWEAIATDSKRRVFIVKENDWTVIVLAPTADERLCTITLCRSDSDVPPADADTNAGAESIVLLRKGHVLAAQQKGPARLIEFGPGPPAPSFVPADFLRRQEEFSFPQGDKGTLVELHHWDLVDSHNRPVRSVNDLAVDRHNRLHAVSSLSHRIYELPKRTHKDTLVTTKCWRLPDDMKLCQHRKAEGLAFDAAERPLVAIDTKIRDDQPNLFLLESLTGEE